MSNKNKPNANQVTTITKKIISNKLAENNLMSKPKATVLTQAVIDCMIALLTDGQSIILKGCGVLSIHEKSERPGRNPKTGEPHLITARKTVTFGKIKGNKKRVASPELRSIISVMAGVDNETARIALDIFIGFIEEVKNASWRVEVRGLGTFYYTEQQERKSRNPKTGESVKCESRTYLKFKASGVLLESINHK